jgi:signal transduction histidine kinase
MSQAQGEGAIHLPWLSPCAASLVALARAPTAAVWSEVRFDPGCVLLLLRHALPPGAPSGLSFFPALLRDPAPLDVAARRLEQRAPGYAAWDRPPHCTVLDSCHTYARLAALLAQWSDRCDPNNAWVAGLLAPLGWLAASAADPVALTSPRFDAAAVARRLNRLWRLPPWLAAVTGHLGLPIEVARDLGADPDLFQVVQFAVALARKHGIGLPLAVAAEPAELAAALGLANADVAEVKKALSEPVPCPLVWATPEGLPLLPDLLRLAAENRRTRDWLTVEAVQQDVDALQRALEHHRAGERERLQHLKLAALAEFAAGAGHEINNPLAVISGQAQYLLRKVSGGQWSVVGESSPASAAGEQSPVAAALQTIIGQATRIHQTLTDLMQFARPPAPKRQTLDAGGLVRAVTESLRDCAEQRKVRLVCPESPAALTLHADPGQAHTALRCLVRNAIEAAPPEGWAGVRVEAGDDGVDLIVEDSGPGPAAGEREHLFDPFYSGRKAGRGRGLGLSTAWRLAREHGGDVRYCQADGDGGPTRFVLRLPRGPAPGAGEPPAERNGPSASHLSSAAVA